MMKKICIVNLNIYCLFNPKSNAPMGGSELDMYTVAMSLRATMNVSVVTGDWDQKDIEERNGIFIYKSFLLEKSLLNYIRAPFLLWDSLKKSNSDIYIFSGAGPEVGIISLFCKLKNKKFIYRTAHIIDCDGSYATSNGLAGLLYEYGLKNTFRIVTSVKQHEEVLVGKYPALKEKIYHINLGIPPHTIKMDKSFVLWVARCETWKKPEIFLEIAATFPEVDFVMICPQQKYSQNYFEKIKKKAQSLSNVVFVDFVPFKDIQSYFNKAKIFVNTSDAEGFTYTLIQSGMARTPVVYLNVNPDTVITKYKIGYIAAGDKGKMMNQIKVLLYNEKDWVERSENAFTYVKEHHDIDIVGKKWSSLFKNM